MIYIRIAVCDDVELNIDLIVDLLDCYSNKKKINIYSFCYNDPSELARSLIEYDLYFLDIMMPKLNGIETAIRIREKFPNAKVIFVTSEKDRAVDAYQIKAKNYILKPITQQILFKILDEVITEYKYENFFIKTKEGEQKINTSEIKYVNIIGKCLTVHCDKKKDYYGTTMRSPFRSAARNLISNENFIYVEPSLILNPFKIELINRNYIQFRDGEQIYYAKSHYDDIITKWKSIAQKESKLDRGI